MKTNVKKFKLQKIPITSIHNYTSLYRNTPEKLPNGVVQAMINLKLLGGKNSVVL